MKFSIKDFLSKCDQIRRKLWKLIFCAVFVIAIASVISEKTDWFLKENI